MSDEPGRVTVVPATPTGAVVVGSSEELVLSEPGGGTLWLDELVLSELVLWSEEPVLCGSVLLSVLSLEELVLSELVLWSDELVLWSEELVLSELVL